MPVTGYFWGEVSGWPLVWDQDDETAIQSPHGGTKIAWGGPPIAPKTARNRLRWVVQADDGAHEEELARLLALGASVLHRSDRATEMAAPEGNEFLLP